MAPQPLPRMDPTSKPPANHPNLGAASIAALVIFLFYLTFTLVCLIYFIVQRRSSRKATRSTLAISTHQTTRTISGASFLSPHVAAPTFSHEDEPRALFSTDTPSTEEGPHNPRTDSASTNGSPTNLTVYIPETQRTRARSSSGATLILLHPTASTGSLQCDEEHDSEGSPGSEDEQVEMECGNLEAGRGRTRASSDVWVSRYYPGNVEVVTEVGSPVEKRKGSLPWMFNVRL